MIRCGHRAELRRGGFRIGTAEILLLLCGTCSRLDHAIRRLALALQPLLPPFVLRAGVDHHRSIRRPVERDLTFIGFIGRSRTVLGRLCVGEDTDLCPCVMGYSLGDQPPAFVLGSG